MKILGISFQNERVHRLIQLALKGGLIVVPSGPGLAQDFRSNADYRKALLGADIAIADSGAMVLFMRIFRGKRLLRVSGLNFLQRLLDVEELKFEGNTFWIHPSDEQRFRNECWLKQRGFKIGESNRYIAPYYPTHQLEDEVLWEQLKVAQPKVIILSIGGGVQERLGFWLKSQYEKAGIQYPAIVCTGAAIGFLSGNQVNIPVWADRLYLGWFFRCLTEPSKFIPRYLSAFPLAYMVIRYGEKLPPMKLN